MRIALDARCANIDYTLAKFGPVDEASSALFAAKAQFKEDGAEVVKPLLPVVFFAGTVSDYSRIEWWAPLMVRIDGNGLEHLIGRNNQSHEYVFVEGLAQSLSGEATPVSFFFLCLKTFY